MVDAIGNHDVFKLVSLRGPRDGLVIDPGADGIELAIVHELARVDLGQPPDPVRRAAAEWEVLGADELAGLPWTTLPGAWDGFLEGAERRPAAD